MTPPQPPEAPQKSHIPAEQVPLVSIGVATHDAERFVADATKSLLAQSYPNLDIHVHDNGSSDRTLEIVRAISAADPRVRITNWPDDRGAAANFNHLLASSRGELFMWASDHDLWDPRYVATLAGALQRSPGAVLAYPRTRLVDEAGTPYGEITEYPDVDDPRPHKRYQRVLWDLDACDMIYGVVRRSAILATRGVEPVWGPDRLLLAQLALAGTFVRVEETLYSRRLNRPQDTSPAAAQAELDRIVGVTDPATRTLFEAESRRLSRERHLAVVRDRLRGIPRFMAEMSTRSAFHYRYLVRDPIAPMIHPGLRTRRRIRERMGRA